MDVEIKIYKKESELKNFTFKQELSMRLVLLNNFCDYKLKEFDDYFLITTLDANEKKFKDMLDNLNVKYEVKE